MSDLVTTAQDSFRHTCIDLYFAGREKANRMAERAKDESGQTAAEYMGVLLVISVIIATIATTNIGTTIVGKMSDLVGLIASGKDGTSAGGAGAAPGGPH